jgi:hypothetical protein
MKAKVKNENGKEIEYHYEYEKNTYEKILENVEKDAAEEKGNILQRLIIKIQRKKALKYQLHLYLSFCPLQVNIFLVLVISCK